IAVGRERMARTHGVAMAALAVDFLAAMLGLGVVARQSYRPLGNPVLQNETDQDPCQGPVGPATFREYAVVTGRAAGDQSRHRAQQIDDGLSSHGQDGGEYQNDKALKGRPCETRRQSVQQRLRCPGDVSPEPPLRLPPRPTV